MRCTGRKDICKARLKWQADSFSTMATMSGVARKNVASDYAAIVLCGPGGQMGPLSRSENLPKALLPIGNRAMVEAPLLYLDNAGVGTVFLLCLDSHESALNTWIKTTYRGSARPIVVAASDEDDLAGSADAVRFLVQQDRFRARLGGPDATVIVLSCDARCDFPLHEVLDAHRNAGATLTSVCFDPAHGADPAVKKQDGGHLLGLVGGAQIDRPTFAPPADTAPRQGSSARLVMAAALADIDDDEIGMRTSMLWQYGNVRVSSRLRQLHLYIVRRAALDVIVREPAIARFDADFVATLCKAQYQSALRARLDLPGNLFCKAHFVRSDGLVGDGGRSGQNGRSIDQSTSTSSSSSSAATQQQQQHGCARINTTRAYAEAQKFALRTTAQEPRIPPSFRVAERSTIGQDCLVAPSHAVDQASGGGVAAATSTSAAVALQHSTHSLASSVNSTHTPGNSGGGSGGDGVPGAASSAAAAGSADGGFLDERSTVKRSILGLNVRIGKNCKITGCTLMDGCSVGDGAKLENCILCMRSQIGERATLKECIVGANYRVPDRAEKKGEELFEGGEISLQ